jgi:hypothetical protein
MSPLAILFVLLNAVALLALPRRWAPLPFLIAACYMTLSQRIDLGPFSFNTIRMLIAAGVARVVMRGERIDGGLNGMDRLILVWAGWMVVSSVFHATTSQGNPLTFRLGLAYDVLGAYFLFRIFVQNIDDVMHFIKLAACVLAPVALEMIQEHVTRRNLFSVFGGVPETCWIREGKLRAQGPFAHPILAGTVGAVCLPMMVGLYRFHARTALIGGLACVSIVFASNSSGPLMSLLFGVGALVLWRWRHLTRQMRIAAVIGYIMLEIVMKDPAYYIIARSNIVGGSTGWHRARLIEMGIAHLNEWWLAGTDHTRHWMPTGVSWSPEHTDITNHYLQYGVVGGLPLMGLFIAAMVAGFRYIGQSLRLFKEKSFEQLFLFWALGAALLTHAATCISVSYFDQSYVFLFLNLAVIGSLRSAVLLQEVAREGSGEEIEIEEEAPDVSGRKNSVSDSLGGIQNGVTGLRFG